VKTSPETQARVDKMPKVIRDEVARLNMRIEELQAELATSFPSTEVKIPAYPESESRDLPPGTRVRFTLTKRKGDLKNDPAPWVDVMRDPQATYRLHITVGPHGGIAMRPSSSNTCGIEVREFFESEK
jgi:hypothetical protein